MNVKTCPKTIIAASLLGGFAAYSSWSERVLHLAGITPSDSLCAVSATFNCEAVSLSHYATLFGIPLAVLGLIYYLITFFIGAYLVRQPPQKTLVGAFGFLTFGALIFSAYLFYVSKFVLGVLCLYCILMYIANAILALSALVMLKPFGGKVLLEGLDAPWAIIRSLFGDKPKGSRIFTVIGLVIVLGFLFSYKAIERFIVPTRSTQSQNNLYTKWKSRPVETLHISSEGSVLTKDYVKGDINTPIEIIEFSDFECGACRNFHLVVDRILKKYSAKVHFTNKSFPLDQSCNRVINRPLHEHSCYASNFTRCAGEQNKQWEAFDQVFTNPILDQASISRAQIVSSLFGWAKDAGLDTQGLSECISSERQMKKIKDDVEEAIALDIEHTPTFFVNGRRTQPDELEELIGILAQE